MMGGQQHDLAIYSLLLLTLLRKETGSGVKMKINAIERIFL